MSTATRSAFFWACAARCASRRQTCQGPLKYVARPASLERRVRHRLQEPAVVRHDDARRVERGELALEPFEARHVEVVRGLVEQDQVGVARSDRASEARVISPPENVESCRSKSPSRKPRPRATAPVWSRQP